MKRMINGLFTIAFVLFLTACPNPTTPDPGLITSTIVFSDGATVSIALNSGLYTNTVSGEGTGAITYTSDTPATATVNASTGEVTLVALGTTVITASKAATTTHTAVTSNYTLTVTSELQVDTFGPEDMIIPEFFSGFTFSRAIEYPEVTTPAENYESIYPSFGPVLVKFRNNSIHRPGDTIIANAFAVEVSIKTSVVDKKIHYSITDENDSINVSIVFDPVTKLFDYSQTLISHMAENIIMGSSVEQYAVVYVEMNDISIGDDLVFQGNYDLLYYRKDTDGSCYVFKVDNTHFYSSSTINGYAYDGILGYYGTDIREPDEVPLISNSDQIFLDCSQIILEEGQAYEEFNALWYENDFFDYAGNSKYQETIEEMFETMPWTPIFPQ